MILGLLACVSGGDGEKPGTEGPADDRAVTSTVYEATSDRDGLLSIPVEVTDDVDVFQVVVHRVNGDAGLEYLYGPDGRKVLDWEDWYDSSYSLTEAFFPMEFASTTNWPVREADGPLARGSWEVVVGTYDRGSYSGNKDVTVEILTRPDRDFGAGKLHAVIAYAEGVREEPGVESAVEEAAAYWGEIYASVGIELEVEYAELAVDPSLPDTYEGLEEVQAFHEQNGERTVLMVIGEDIAGDVYTYGEAGGIPGPYAAAEHAAVEVAWLANAGSDAEFSNADILLMGETMAHEVGHYLGLFHPVEDGFEYWDALDDTDECVGYNRCEDALGTNLMYPYPVCTTMNANSCVRQDQLTGEQAGVAHRYVGVE